MRKVLFAIALLCTAIFAQPTDSEAYKWPRSYFASVGFNVIVTRGDFFDRTIKVTDEDGTIETINFPTTHFLMSPDYNIGVNIREFTLAFSFQYWSMQTDIKDFPPDIKEQDMRFYRLGLEFTYNFFYPETFQAGLGLGYSYSNLKINKNASSTKGFSDSELMGSAVALIGSIRYYITDFFCLAPSLRIYENWYKAAYTKASGTTNLDSYIWQTYIAVSINAMFQF